MLLPLLAPKKGLPTVAGEVGWGLFELAVKLKSDPTLSLPCMQGREPILNLPANM